MYTKSIMGSLTVIWPNLIVLLLMPFGFAPPGTHFLRCDATSMEVSSPNIEIVVMDHFNCFKGNISDL